MYRIIELSITMQIGSVRRIAIISAASALAACTTLGGPDDLIGSVGMASPTGVQTSIGMQPPGLPSNPSSTSLTPSQIHAVSPLHQPEADEYVQEAPPMRVERLQDLPRRADGSMILPSASPLHVIDVQEVRNSLANSESASGATRAPSATQGTQPSLPPVPPPPASD